MKEGCTILWGNLAWGAAGVWPIGDQKTFTKHEFIFPIVGLLRVVRM